MATIIASFVRGTVASILVTAFFEWLKRPILSVELEYPPLDKDLNNNVAQKARFLRVWVKNREPRLILRWLSRNAALQCEAEITFLHVGDRQDVFAKPMPGRWTGWPEPQIVRIHESNRLSSKLSMSVIYSSNALSYRPERKWLSNQTESNPAIRLPQYPSRAVYPL